MKDQLLNRIHDHTATIAIIGLGYVGLPLAVAFAEKGFPVVGIDVDPRKVDALNRGESYVQDVPSARLAGVRGQWAGISRPGSGGRGREADSENRPPRGTLIATTDYSVLDWCDAAIICVPTPLNKTRDPDVRFLIAAGESVAQHIHPGMLVVLESTTYPGTTEELLLPMLEKGIADWSGQNPKSEIRNPKSVGQDFFLAFSPERIDPGRADYTVENTPKVVGGVTPACQEVAVALYGETIERVVPVSSTQAAEMVKLLENTFRAVNIALVNETAIMCDKLGIDVWEVIEAAATKPYGFMKFTPGPGVGGHCLDGQETIRYRWGPENGVITLETLYQRARARSPRTFDHLGGSFVAPTGLEVLSVDPATGEQAWERVTYLFEREYTGTVVDVVTADNRRLTVTDRHPMLVHTAEGLAVREAVALGAGDLLPLVHGPAAASAEGELPRIRVIDLLPADLARHVRVRHPQGWEHARAALQPLIGEKTRDAIRHNSLSLSVWRQLPDELRGDPRDLILLTGRGPSHSAFPAEVVVDEGFARLLGYYLAEGCISEWDGRPRLRFTFNRAKADYLADVRTLSGRLGVRISEYNDPVWQTTTLKAAGWLLPWLLRDVLKTGVDSHTMRVPDQLMAAPAPLRGELLKGLFRGDGDVYVRGGARLYHKDGRDYVHQDNAGQVGYFTSSPELFEQMTFLLQELGFTPARKARKPQLRFYASSDLERLEGWFLGEKAARLAHLRTEKRRCVSSRRPRAEASYALAQVKQVIAREDQTRVYSVEVAGTHTFAATSGIYVHNCIPLDPHYLSWKLKTLNYNARFIQLAGEINTEMPKYWVDKVQAALNEAGKPVKGSVVLVLGVAYKKDIDDVRESPALDVIELLRQRGADVRYHDPYVPVVAHNSYELRGEPDLDAALAAADCVVVVTDHASYDWGAIRRLARLIVDTRHAI